MTNTILAILTKAAMSAKVSAVLLVAICSHESQDFTLTYNHKDGGSPSYGICQVKEATARWLGFKGKTKELMNPKVNATYAAKYLAKHADNYGEEDWCKVTAAYNAGRYNESPVYPGYPRNIKYIRLVQKKLPETQKSRLACGLTKVAKNEHETN
jgi:hypothetical protein